MVLWFKPINKGGVRVGEITAKTNLSRPAVSHHLRIMKDAGFIKVRKESTMNFYYFDPEMQSLARLAATLQRAVELTRALPEVCNHKDGMPQRFVNGVNAALLAPTAMNQQKFFFTLQPDGSVKAACGKGFYTKLDLGIVKYHFELGSGRKL